MWRLLRVELFMTLFYSNEATVAQLAERLIIKTHQHPCSSTIINVQRSTSGSNKMSDESSVLQFLNSLRLIVWSDSCSLDILKRFSNKG